MERDIYNSIKQPNTEEWTTDGVWEAHPGAGIGAVAGLVRSPGLGTALELGKTLPQGRPGEGEEESVLFFQLPMIP